MRVVTEQGEHPMNYLKEGMFRNATLCKNRKGWATRPHDSVCGVGILRLRLIFALMARKDQSSFRMTLLRCTEKAVGAGGLWSILRLTRLPIILKIRNPRFSA